jgi:glycosyltransferase involved in cell wall biosynthesis
MTDLSIFLTDLEGGGAEKVMVNLANGFSQHGQSVDLVLVRKIGQYFSHLHPNIHIVDLQQDSLLSSLPALVYYLKTKQPKILLSALEDTNIIAICATKLARARTSVVVTVHNHLSSEARYASGLKRKVVPHLLRWVYPHANAVVAVSHGVAADVSKWTGLSVNQVQVIYNPIVTPDLQIKQHNVPDHPWLQQTQIPIILGIGRLHPQKDFPTLISAFARVRQQTLARLLILGEGEEHSHLESLIQQLDLQDDVQLVGFVSNPYAYMSRSSLLVLSSAWEGFGNVLVEAMATGTPVISTACESGPSEILLDGQYGKLVEVGDVEAMADAIRTTLTEKTDSDKLKQRANEFSLEVAIDHYKRIFQSCKLFQAAL